ncbi:hypothetical protein PH191_10540 [Actinomycetospora callitridis]|nr:hypothetical protein [Actinomycetospora callitridis]
MKRVQQCGHKIGGTDAGPTLGVITNKDGTRSAAYGGPDVVDVSHGQLEHGPDETDLQRLASTHLLPPPRRDEALGTEDRAAVSWLRRASRPATDLADSLALGALLHDLGTAADGRATTSSTHDKRRAVLHRVAGYAMDTGVLAANPVTGRRTGTAQVTGGVDPRVVVNPAQARQLLAAVTYVSGRRRSDRERGWQLRAFFACLYYAGLRPGEAQQLRDTDAKLPAAGWGELVLSGSLTGVSGEHYNDGLRDPDARPLKRRRREAVRRVPAPPALVAILRDHLDHYGAAADGRLFPALSGGRVRESVYTRIWKEAREIGLSPAGGLTAGGPPVRPPARGAVLLAQRRGAAHRGRRAGRPLGQGPALGLRRVPRRRARRLQRPHPRSTRRRGLIDYARSVP